MQKISKELIAIFVFVLFIGSFQASAQFGTPQEEMPSGLADILEEGTLAGFEFEFPTLENRGGFLGNEPKFPRYSPDGQTEPLEVVQEHIEFAIWQSCQNIAIDQAFCDGLDAISLKVGDAIGRLSDCSKAAVEYGENIYPTRQPLDAIREYTIIQNFDVSCLSSIVDRWATDGTVVKADTLPNIFISGGESNPKASADRAVGFLLDANEVFCGALIRPNNQILTARHCFEGKSIAFRGGSVTFVSLNSPDVSYPVKVPLDKSLITNSTVADDWIVLDLVSENVLVAPEIEFVDLLAPTDIVLFGHFDNPKKSSDLKLSTDQEIGKSIAAGLRWPKEGACYAIAQENACVKTLCQTVRGFSGTPIFLPSRSPIEGTLRVLGLVSRAITDEKSSKECKAVGSGMTAIVNLTHLQP